MMQNSQEEEKKKRKRGRFFPWLHKLPKELTFDIFSRLPVESLLQCKRVLKSWHTLISDPQFVNAHLLRASSHVQQYPDVLVFVSRTKLFRVSQVGSRYESVKSLSIPRSFKFDYSLAVNSCNGLLAFQNYDYKNQSLFVHIWNPFTRKTTICPFVTDIPRQICSLRLAHGFGYDPILNEYKVVALFRTNSAEFESVVCTIGSTSWRRIKAVPFKPSKYNNHNVHLNGIVYWFASADQSKKKGIGCFGIRDVKFGFIACPPQAVSYSWSDKVNLIALGDYLCLVDYTSHENVVVWALKKHCGGDEVWTNQFVLTMPEPIYSLQLLYVFNNGEILLRMVGMNQKKCVYYEPKENRYRDNETLTALMSSSNYSRTFAHVGSLVSPPLPG